MPTVHISLVSALHIPQLPAYFAAVRRLQGIDTHIAILDPGTLSPELALSCPAWVQLCELPSLVRSDAAHATADSAPDPSSVPSSLLEFSRLLALLLDISPTDSLLVIQTPDVLLRSISWADPCRLGATCTMFESGNGSPSPACAALRSSSIVHILNACRAYPFRAAELDPPLTLLWRALTANSFPTRLVPYKQTPLPDGSPTYSSTVINPAHLAHSVPYPTTADSVDAQSTPSAASSAALTSLLSVRYLYDLTSSLTSSLPSHLHPSLIVSRAIRRLLPLIPANVSAQAHQNHQNHHQAQSPEKS